MDSFIGVESGVLLETVIHLGKTHKKKCFFRGRTTKDVGRLTPPPLITKQKNTLFSINPVFKTEKKT